MSSTVSAPPTLQEQIHELADARMGLKDQLDEVERDSNRLSNQALDLRNRLRENAKALKLLIADLDLDD